mmetsp:Transcript_40890/g.83665  ORF Transcript_40890/g.83665 Transcript_40890/m.83665 type:complete len:216 (-) Transcript_40890:157-804(-)
MLSRRDSLVAHCCSISDSQHFVAINEPASSLELASSFWVLHCSSDMTSAILLSCSPCTFRESSFRCKAACSFASNSSELFLILSSRAAFCKENSFLTSNVSSECRSSRFCRSACHSDFSRSISLCASPTLRCTAPRSSSHCSSFESRWFSLWFELCKDALASSSCFFRAWRSRSSFSIFSFLASRSEPFPARFTDKSLFSRNRESRVSFWVASWC